MLIITVIEVSSEPKIMKINLDPPGDFDHFFKGSNSVDNIMGKDFEEFGGFKGHVADIVDTKSTPNDILDICDNVVIEWTRDPPLREPWVTYHVYKVEEELDGWSFWFDKRSSGKYPPWGKPEGEHPPFWDDYKSHYVDNGNINGPWDGTKEHPYQYIQDGIDVANSGHKIIVNYGIYEEKLMVEKNDIIIIPMTFDQPIIDGGGSGSVVTITGDWVTLYGFTIQNSGIMEEDAGIDLFSDNTTIFGNNIKENQNGIYLHQSANNNEIYDNNVQSNVWGVFVWEESNNNKIYTNNLISNTGFNAKDKSINLWYSEFYNGNYWDDYTGLDSNDDGIGDTPYVILDGNNQDLYPFINPIENIQPGNPIIDGPNYGKPNENYIYSFVSLDLNSHDLIYEVNWGDGFEEKSLFFSPSGEQISFNHSWENKGNYTIMVRSMDYYGAISDWSTLEVTMPKNKSLIEFKPLILRLIQRFPILNLNYLL